MCWVGSPCSASCQRPICSQIKVDRTRGEPAGGATGADRGGGQEQCGRGRAGVGGAFVFEVVGQGGAAVGAEEHGAAGAALAPDAADLRLLRRAQRLRRVRGDLAQVELTSSSRRRPVPSRVCTIARSRSGRAWPCTSPASERRRPLCWWKRGSRSSTFLSVRTCPAVRARVRAGVAAGRRPSRTGCRAAGRPGRGCTPRW